MTLSLMGYDIPVNWPGLFNALVSLGIIFVCVCRADKVTHHVLLRVKLSYLGLIMGAFTNAMTPWLHEAPGWGSAAFAFSVLTMLVADSFQWRRGAPESCTDRAPLGDY